MKNFLRWVLVLPAALGTMLTLLLVLKWAWGGYTDATYATRLISVGSYYFSSLAGVCAGVYTAPAKRRTLARIIFWASIIFLCVIYPLLLGFGYRASINAGFGWFAWINIYQLLWSIFFASGAIYDHEKGEEEFLAQTMASRKAMRN